VIFVDYLAAAGATMEITTISVSTLTIGLPLRSIVAAYGPVTYVTTVQKFSTIATLLSDTVSRFVVSKIRSLIGLMVQVFCGTVPSCVKLK
jgi:hypothetical protein